MIQRGAGSILDGAVVLQFLDAGKGCAGDACKIGARPVLIREPLLSIFQNVRKRRDQFIVSIDATDDMGGV